MLTIDLFEDFKEPTLIDALRDFLPVALKVLDLDHVPKIKLKKELKDTHVPTFGRFTNDEQVVYCVINNRHPNDILRTLAHEMAHYAQGERGELDADSWHTGSPVENEANAQAGVVMREFNKQFPQYMALNPIIVETADYDRDMQSDPSNPLPFPKGTTLVNVSDVYDWYKLGMAVPALDKADPRIFNKGVPHTVFAFGSEEEEHRMMPLLKRLGFTLHDIDKPEDYEKAIRASDVLEHLERYVAEEWSKKYKDSINCSNPKGFSQKAHCAGRKKNTNEAEEGCPPATQDITLNLKNRQKAIDEYHYGPLNPNLPNNEYWAELADKWNTTDIDSVKQNRCGNCGAFDVSKDMQACIAKGIGSEPGSSAMDAVDAGQLGYCKFLKFKCASKRTCDAWIEGGPITEGQHCDAKNAVPELKAALTKRKTELKNASAKTAYNKIDKIMTRIAQTYNISGQELHDLWTERYGEIPDTWVLDENFADGKGPGRPGDSQRHGIPKGATIAQLEKAAKAPGRKGQLARWQINMRRGKKK
jgi:hypothetical protein